MRLEKYENEEVPVVAEKNGVIMYLENGTVRRYEGERIPPTDSAFPVEEVDSVEEAVKYIGKQLGVNMDKERKSSPPNVQERIDDEDEEKEDLDSDAPPFLE